MRIWLDPAKWRASVHHPGLGTVLTEQNVVAPAGTVGAEPAPPGQQMQYVASVKGACRRPSNTATPWCAPGRGAIVHLKDIAASSSPPRLLALQQAERRPHAIIGGLPVAGRQRAGGGQGRAQVWTAWRRPSPKHPLPDPLRHTLFVAESVREVVKTLLEAGVLVLLVVFISSKAGAPRLSDARIPVSLIGAFSAFVALGFTLNTLTLLRCARHRSGGGRRHRRGRSRHPNHGQP